LFGIPGETQVTIRETIEFAKKIKPDSAQFAIVIPHPGTELYAVCKKNGWLKHKNWEDFSSCNSLIETPEMSRKDVEKARIRAYRQFYFRPSYILRTIFKIRSFKDLRAVVKSASSIIKRMSFFKQYIS
jgi:radical SAM superfamily enzyme YgiQ (UPF0313 family)